MKTAMASAEIELSAYRDAWSRLSVKADKYGSRALAAVKQDGDALQYVKEQMFDGGKK